MRRSGGSYATGTARFLRPGAPVLETARLRRPDAPPPIGSFRNARASALLAPVGRARDGQQGHAPQALDSRG